MRLVILALALACVGFGQAEAASTVEDEIVRVADSIAATLNDRGYNADFTLKSLKEIDRFLDDESAGGKPRSGGILANDLDSNLLALGLYVGEVLRRRCDGKWVGNAVGPDIALELMDGSRIWPVQRVMKRFQNGPEDSVYAYGFVLSTSCP